MARTPLMRQLQQAVSIAAEAGTTEATVNEVRANRHSRREFIRRAGLLGAGAGVLALGGGVATAAASPAVVAPGVPGVSLPFIANEIPRIPRASTTTATPPIATNTPLLLGSGAAGPSNVRDIVAPVVGPMA